MEHVTRADDVRPGDTIGGVGRVARIWLAGHWTVLVTEDGGEYLANGSIVNLDRYNAIHLRRVTPSLHV